MLAAENFVRDVLLWATVRILIYWKCLLFNEPHATFNQPKLLPLKGKNTDNSNNSNKENRAVMKQQLHTRLQDS